MSNTSVLLLIYQRSDLMEQLIEPLRRVRVARLYIAADGPCSGDLRGSVQCRKAREVVNMIDWPCEVKTLFRRENLGVFEAVSQAIDWFFSFEEEGVILEEDCIPHEDFFRYCAELLTRYRDFPQIMQISGTNFQPSPRSGGASYFFSRYNHVWGWATWKRAWKLYRKNMEGLEEFLSAAETAGFWESGREQLYWEKIFFKTARNQVQSWAYRWTYSIWAAGGLCAYPDVNMVSNRGFRQDATHTKHRDRLKADRPLSGIGNIVHPCAVLHNRLADHWSFERMYWGTPLARLGERFRKVRALVGNLLLAAPSPAKPRQPTLHPARARVLSPFLERNG